MKDDIVVCFYCGEVMNAPTKEQIKMFGKPKCCSELMLKIKASNVNRIIKSIDKLKINLEKELLKGFGCDQYLDMKI